jgi:cell division protein ZapA (FtsZ GTPase activity inhibitor)
MKQKHTLNIANIQICVVTDATPDEVARITGLLDRKIREITLKSRCPKTEAALLCAMEFAAERIDLQEQAAELEDRCAKYEVVLEGFKRRAEEQNAEIEKLRTENAVLRSLVTAGNGKTAPDPVPPAVFFAEVADAQAAPAEVTRRAEEPKTETPEASEEKPARRIGNRVGLMFEQLSFDDAD